MLLKAELGDLAGLDAVVIGRSNIVGKPMAQLLLGESCTVTIAHSRTRDLPDVVRRADIVVAAVGRPEMVRGDWIKPGATVIDVGINRIPTDDGKGRLVGDVDFDEAARGRRRDHAGARRRRADDHRHAVAQHLRRRAPPRRPCRSGRSYDRCAPCSPPPSPTAVDAERAFARDAQRIGQWTAFRKYADRDAVMFTPQAVWAQRLPEGPQGSAEGDQLVAGAQLRLVRRPDRGQHRARGSSATARPGGYFTTVWQRDRERLALGL